MMLYFKIGKNMRNMSISQWHKQDVLGTMYAVIQDDLVYRVMAEVALFEATSQVLFVNKW